MGFYVGQEVECINVSEQGIGNNLILGGKYTVAGFLLINHKPGIFLTTCPNTHGGLTHNVGWYCSRFRPITKTKTDISIFTAMLGPKQKETING